MQLLLEIKDDRDFEVLLPLLKRLNIYFKNVSIENAEAKTKTPAVQSEKSQSLHWFAGSMPELDAEAFNEYINKSRAEWER